MPESVQDMERQAAELAARIASAKAVERTAEDNELVVIPLVGSDGEMHLHKVSAGAARLLLKNSSIAAAAKTEDKAKAKPKAKSGDKPKHPLRRGAGWLINKAFRSEVPDGE